MFTVKDVTFFCDTSCILGGIVRPRRQIHVGILLKLSRSLTNTKCGIRRDRVTVNSNNLRKGKFLGKARAGLGFIPRRSASFVFYAMKRRRKFLNSTNILLLFLVLVLELVRLTRQRPFGFKQVCNCYILSMFLFRLFVGIKVILKLAPMVNVPLPFFDCKNDSL